MAIEDILRALEQQVQHDIDAVDSEAREHSEHIIEEAEVEAARIRERYLHQVEKAASAEGARTVNAARLKAKMVVSSARGDALTGVYNAASTEFANVRKSGTYPELFRKLAAEAVNDLGDGLVLHVDPADKQLAEEFATSLRDARVETDISTEGGVVAEGHGGTIIRRNTIEDRTDRAWQFLQADVARVLFA